jgi:CheY-like chemotaxis protein
MGGRLTVSSKEQNGSTFTFILPYKVSIACDSSDYSDEFSDMEHNVSASDDTTTEGFFQFQPPNLGHLVSSSGANRTHNKLLPHKFCGFSESSFSFPSTSNDNISKGTCSVDDSNSLVDASDMSESASSSSHKHHLYNAHAWFQNGIADSSQHMVVNSTTQCASSNSKSEAIKSISKPKILLVEDNKINIMVTQSMMKQLGHNIDVVNNGAEAVRAVQRCTYDLVLMVIYGSQNFCFSTFSLRIICIC